MCVPGEPPCLSGAASSGSSRVPSLRGPEEDDAEAARRGRGVGGCRASLESHVQARRSPRPVTRASVCSFARRKGCPQKAEAYLQGALKSYLAEGWALPVTHTRKQLAGCQKHLGQIEKYPLS